MQRDRAYYRMVRSRTIRKKLGILKRLDGGNDWPDCGWVRGRPGRLSKGKIHCSCWMCRTKSFDYLSHSDEKKKIDARQQIKDYCD